MKEELRYKFKIKRKYFQHSIREVADGAIADAFLTAYGQFDSFFIYNSFGSEADTKIIIDRLICAGKRVFLPRVEGKDMVAVQYFGKENELIKNGYGIYEPQGQAYDGEIDVCAAPLLAVNSKGFRLGYGGGYYDRYFSTHKKVIKVGLGYFLQMTDEFKEDGSDEPLDSFVSERGIYYFER